MYIHDTIAAKAETVTAQKAETFNRKHILKFVTQIAIQRRRGLYTQKK